MHILLIEDNNDIAANIGDYMEAKGHEVDFAADGTLGLNLLKQIRYDIVILDISMPKMNGLKVLRTLREDLKSEVPVILLTARDAIEDKIAGFEAGADDYLTKPASLKELELRIASLHRRRRTPSDAAEVLTCGDLSFNVGFMEVTRAGQSINLNPSQRRLLEYLMRNQRRPVPREELEDVIGCRGSDTNVLSVQMSGLRRLLDKPFTQPLLHTVHGVGYRLVAPD